LERLADPARRKSPAIGELSPKETGHHNAQTRALSVHQRTFSNYAIWVIFFLGGPGHVSRKLHCPGDAEALRQCEGGK